MVYTPLNKNNELPEEIIPEKALTDKKLFNKVTYTTFRKLLFNIQHYSKSIEPKNIIGNITRYKEYDFYTLFIHILDILETIDQYGKIDYLINKFSELNVVSEQKKQDSIEEVLNGEIQIFDFENKCVILLNKKTESIKKRYEEKAKLNKRTVDEFFIIYPIESLKEWKNDLEKHYFLKNRTDEEREDMITTFCKNNISDLIMFIKNAIMNYLTLDRR